MDDSAKGPDGTYQKLLAAAHNHRAMLVFYGDIALGPSPFLATVAALQFAKL